MNRLTVPWAEFMEPAWKTSMQFSCEKHESILCIKINDDDLNKDTGLGDMVWQILGFNKTYTNASGVAFRSYLNRRTPAKHPRFPFMRATEVLDIQGIGKAADIPTALGRGVWGDYESWVIKIKFATPLYTVNEDQVPAVFSYNPDALVLPPAEYTRWTEWEPAKPTVETISKRGATWTYTDSAVRALVAGGVAPGNSTLKVPKAKIRITWRDVPVNFIANGLVYPKNIIDSVGKLNSLPFPQEPIQLTTIPGIGPGYQFPVGTLLMLEPDIRLKVQNPGLTTGLRNVPAEEVNNYLAKSCDITFTMLHFDPSSSLDTSVRLQVGRPSIIIRGHNLFSTPAPISRAGNLYQWWPAINVPVAPPAINPAGTLVLDDRYLLYQYYNFENIFQHWNVQLPII